MTRLSIKQAKALGIIPSKTKKKPAAAKVTLPLVQWDAKVTTDGVWIQVPFVPPSLNVWKNWHHMKQYDYKMELYDSIWKLALAMKLPKFEKATVKISYYHATKRRRDPSDNYAPKFLMDALVKGGVLTDDNGELVKVIPVGMEYDPERPRTEIYIYRME